MDDSSTANVGNSDDRIPLGLGSFAQQEREQFGQNIRLAMEYQDIHNRSDADINEGGARSTFRLDDYTRVECGEPVPDYCHGRIRDRHAPSFTSEAPARYATSAQWVINTLCH